MEFYEAFEFLQTFYEIVTLRNVIQNVLVKGATKLCFMNHLRVVRILISTGLYKSAFSTYYILKICFRLSCFCIFDFKFLVLLYVLNSMSS